MKCFVFLFVAILAATGIVFGQAEIRADRQVALESGRGTLAIKRGPGGKLYVLNRLQKCVSVYGANRELLGHISRPGNDPEDLRDPVDFTVDREGKVVVADGSGQIKVFLPDGQLLASFPFVRPQSVAVLSDGRILVTGFPTDSLISIYDLHGRPLGTIGEPVRADDHPFFNSVLNHGTIVVDEQDDNIYYVFCFLLTPTIRKYSADGRLLAEWHPQGGALFSQILDYAKKKYAENKATSNYGGTTILANGWYDRRSETFWVSSGSELLQVDTLGRTIGNWTLTRPDGTSLQAQSFFIDGDRLWVGTSLAGVFEIRCPEPRTR